MLLCSGNWSFLLTIFRVCPCEANKHTCLYANIIQHFVTGFQLVGSEGLWILKTKEDVHSILQSLRCTSKCQKNPFQAVNLLPSKERLETQCQLLHLTGNHCKELTSQCTLVFSWIEFCMIQGMLNNLKVACKCNGKVWGMREEKCNSLCLRCSRTFLGYDFCRFNRVLFLNGAIFGEEAPEISQMWVVPKCVSKCP